MTFDDIQEHLTHFEGNVTLRTRKSKQRVFDKCKDMVEKGIASTKERTRTFFRDLDEQEKENMKYVLSICFMYLEEEIFGKRRGGYEDG